MHCFQNGFEGVSSGVNTQVVPWVSVEPLRGVFVFMSADAARVLSDSQSPPRSIGHWWLGLALSRKLDLAIVMVLLPLMLITASLGGIVTNIRLRSELVTQYRNTIFTVYELKIALLNIETGSRGYALSGNQSFLEPYRSGLRDASAALQRLRVLQTFPQQITTLEQAVISYQTWVAANLETVKSGQSLPSDMQQALLERGKQRFDGLRVKFESLNSLALQGFSATHQEINRGIDWLAVLPWASVALIVIGALALRLALRRLILDPIRQLERAAQVLADGDGSIRLSYLSSDEMGKLSRTFNQTAETLAVRTTELQRSNRDLEQFAYVASHDLQEPLRMVSSYTQLLGKRYAGKLDERADTYIHYAVDGANRMQALIQDLLKYSRVGTRQAPLVPTSASEVVAEVLRSFELTITESGSHVTVTELPEVLADRVQLSQIFQNLIGNALKFRRDGVAHSVTVSAVPDGALWQFSVRDNGIGIGSEYFERIFVIFQRLNTRESFAGSGIGLAICQLLVERHGGKIWLESAPGEGSAFHFTLQAALPQTNQQQTSQQSEGGQP